jgi:hypothetical protein
METHETDARAALDAIAEGRRRMADRVVTPWWYHPALGILVGALMAVPSTQERWAIVAVDVAGAIGLAVLTQAYRNRTGVWPASKLRGPAGRLRIVYVAVILVVYFTCAALEFVAGWRGATVVAGAVVAVLTVVYGRRYDEKLRAELRGEA